MFIFRPIGEKFDKAREWKVPAVSIQWLNDVMFGSVNAAQCMSNAKYQEQLVKTNNYLVIMKVFAKSLKIPKHNWFTVFNSIQCFY